MFKFICISLILHASLLMIFFINNVAMPNMSFQKSSASSPPPHKTKLSFIKISHNDLIDQEFQRQAKSLQTLSAEKKLSLLDDKLKSISNLETSDHISQAVLNHLFPNQSESTPSTVFDHDSAFYEDVYNKKNGDIYVIMSDRNQNTIEYTIPKSEVTAEDKILVKIYSKAKTNENLRVILRNFAKAFKKNATP